MNRRRHLLVAALLAASGIGPARAQSDPEPAVAMRFVIQAQLDAFAADDAERAFRYAAPGIQQQFGTAEVFMRMVREQYPAVYRPRRVAFDAPRGEGDERIQPVRVVDTDGVAWIAVYLMQRQRDRSWRIGGCQLVRDGQSTAT